MYFPILIFMYFSKFLTEINYIMNLIDCYVLADVSILFMSFHFNSGDLEGALLI